MANREILLSLLKQLLDEKLQPLEKRNTNEIKDLGTLAVSMKTIEKNVKASCDMTNRIIEKMKQKAEEEKKKKEATTHKRSQSMGGSSKTANGKRTMARNKTEANLHSKTNTGKTLVRNKTVGSIMRTADKMKDKNKTTPGSSAKHNIKPMSLTASKSTRDFNKKEDKVHKMTRNNTTRNVTEPGHKRNKSEGVVGKEKITKKENSKPKVNDNKKKTESKKNSITGTHDTKKEEAPKTEVKKEETQKTEVKKEEAPKAETKKEEAPKAETKKEEEVKKEEEKKEPPKEEPKPEPPKPKVNKGTVISKNMKRISQYLQPSDQFILSKLNKETLVSYSEILKSEYDTKLETSQKDIDTLLAKHPKEELEKEIKPFVIGKGALKAIGMLNGKNYLTKFENTPTPTTELLLVYRLFFQLIAPKHPEFVSIKDNDQFWSKISVYFTENAHDELGKLVESEFKEIDLSNENICKIIDMCKPYQSILTPTYYSKNCPTTGLFVFLVKETLEYIGAINEKKTQPGRLYRNLEYRLNSLKEKKEKINAFIEKVKK